MLNKVILMGRLTKDPEIRHTNSGKAVASFTIATDNGYGDDKKTDFINCVAWEGTAVFIEKHFTKGQLIIIDGRISTRNYEDREGRKIYVTEVLVKEVHFGGSKKKDETESDDLVPLDNIPDDLPFGRA